MCSESILVFKDFISPIVGLIGTMFVASMTYIGIFVKLRKDTQMKWIDEFRKEITSLITYSRSVNNLISSGRFDEDKRDKLLYDITSCVTNIQLYLNLERASHALLRDKMEELVSASSKANDKTALNTAVDIFGTLAKRVIDEEKAEINKIELPPFNYY